MHNLLATLLICLGMSNSGMPISNYQNSKLNLSPDKELTEKKAVQNINYSLNIEQTQFNEVNGQIVNDFGNLARQFKGTNYNSAINVKAETYTDTELKYTDISTYTNYAIIGDVKQLVDNGYIQTGQQVGRPTAMLSMLQITPYAANVNTEIEINVKMNLDLYFPEFQLATTKFRGYYIETYKTATRNLSSLFDRQLTQDSVNTIITTLNDPNNYQISKTETFIESEYQETLLEDDIETIDLTLSIAPNTDNYYFYLIIPVANGTYQGQPFNDPDGYLANYSSATPIIKPDGYTINGIQLIDDGTREIVDIPGLMFYVLTMPFTFISQAFNLTLFAGTQYQVNISNLFLAILAVLIFAWLIRTIISKGK